MTRRLVVGSFWTNNLVSYYVKKLTILTKRLTEKLLQIHERLKIELDELRREIGRSQSQLNYVKLEIKMPDSDHSDNDDGSQASSTATKGYVTLTELRKYIMMAADEMSTSMKT